MGCFDRAAMMDDPVKVFVCFDGVDLLHGQNRGLVREFDAALGTTASDDFASARGGHPGAEATLVRVFLFRGLIRFLAHNEVLLCF